MRTSGALLALRAQAGVDLQRRVGGRHARASGGARWPRRCVRRRDLRVRALDRVVHEHDVRIGAVGQLEAAVAAHRDRPPSGSAPPSRPRWAATVSPATVSVASSVASVRLDSPAPTAVTSSSPTSSPTAIRSSSRRRTARTARTRSSADSWRPAAASISLVSASDGQRRQVAAEHLHALRLALQQVGGVAGGGQHPGQPLGDLALVAEHREVPVGAAERVADPAEAEQPGVRVGGVGEPLEHHRQQGALDRRGPGDARGHRLEVPQRRRRVLVAECREPGAGRLGREPHVRRPGSGPPRSAAAGRTASRAAGAPRGGGGATPSRAPPPAPSGGRASGRGGAARRRRRARRGCGAAGRAGSGARAVRRNA